MNGDSPAILDSRPDPGSSGSGEEVLTIAGYPRPVLETGNSALFQDCFFGAAPCSSPYTLSNPEACTACMTRSIDGLVAKPPTLRVEGICAWVAGSPAGTAVTDGSCSEDDAVEACEDCGCATESECFPR